MCKVFIDVVPTIQIVGGLIHVTNAEGACEVWPISLFSAFISAGMRTVRDFHDGAVKPVALKGKPAAH